MTATKNDIKLGVFCILLAAALYYFEQNSEADSYKTPNKMHTEGIYLGPRMDTVEIEEHKNHADCPGLGCPPLY